MKKKASRRMRITSKESQMLIVMDSQRINSSTEKTSEKEGMSEERLDVRDEDGYDDDYASPLKTIFHQKGLRDERDFREVERSSDCFELNPLMQIHDADSYHPGRHKNSTD